MLDCVGSDKERDWQMIDRGLEEVGIEYHCRETGSGGNETDTVVRGIGHCSRTRMRGHQGREREEEGV